jgi:hypothetical protein
MVDPQLEGLAKREGDDQFAEVGSVLEIACECGRSGCGEVIALPWCVYEQAQREPRSDPRRADMTASWSSRRRSRQRRPRSPRAIQVPRRV